MKQNNRIAILNRTLAALIFVLLASCATPNLSMRGRYVRETPDLKPEIKKAILAGDIILGMTKNQVLASRGTPIHKNEGKVGSQALEFWTFPDMLNSPFANIYFKDDIVVKTEALKEAPFHD